MRPPNIMFTNTSTSTWIDNYNPSYEEEEITITIKRKRKVCPKDITPYQPYVYPKYVPYNDQECLIQRFFQEHPDARVAMISCPCRRCSVYI